MPDTVTLSESDLQIIQCLRKDARSSVARIAKSLRMPTSSVRHRMQRLVKEGVLKFDAMMNPLLLGYQIWVMIEVQAEVSKIESVAQQLAAIPEVYLVYIMTGRYDILVGAVFRSTEEQFDFMTSRLSKISGITRTSSSSILRLVKRTMSFALPQTMPARASGSVARTTKTKKKDTADSRERH
jgi:DNA-binding Lrp family transcriptional regulator